MATKTTSPYRRMQAQQTRDRITDTAQKLFAEQGYGATSIDAIATEAGVALRTVYAVFGTKRDILAEIQNRWTASWQPQERAQQAAAESTARRRLRAAAHYLRTLYEDGYDVLDIVRSAGDDTEETRALRQAHTQVLDQALDTIADALQDTARRPVEESRSIFRALASPGIYHELVQRSGWSPDQYETWISDALARQLGAR